MTHWLIQILVFIWGFQTAVANVEKVIFRGPSRVRIPHEHPTLEDLQLSTLSPQHLTLRTDVSAKFPTNSKKWGIPSWFLLEQLSEGQRYEVRVCWAATQPTSFRLYAHEISSVFESVELITSLADYSHSQHSLSESLGNSVASMPKSFRKSDNGLEEFQSVILLQIFAAADYYTTNATLMENVPPVFVDIVLDPYILNILPQSLIPTGGYMIIISICSWFLAKFVTRWLQIVARMDEQKKEN